MGSIYWWISESQTWSQASAVVAVLPERSLYSFVLPSDETKGSGRALKFDPGVL